MQLIKYDNACRAVAEAKSVDEVREIRDVSIAMKAYARQANNHELEADAIEIRMRATRRMDEMRQEQKATIGLNEGGRPKTGVSNTSDSRPTLAEVGIDKNLAKEGRKLGSLSNSEFEEAVKTARGAIGRVVKGAVSVDDVNESVSERNTETVPKETPDRDELNDKEKIKEVSEAVKISCENLSLIAKSNQAPEHIKAVSHQGPKPALGEHECNAVKLALNLSKELKEFEQSGNRKVLLEALRDTFLIVRAIAASRSEIARTLAIEALIHRIPDISERFLLKIVETLAKAGTFDLSAITGVSKGGHFVNIKGTGQHRTPELARGSSSPNSNPIKDLESFVETLDHISNHFGTKTIENKEETGLKNTPVPHPEEQPEKQVDGQPYKPEAGLSKVGLSEPVTNLESEVIVLRRKVLKKDNEIENLKSELELLKKGKEKAEKDKKEAEEMFMKISEDYDQIVGLYEVIYNHFHLGDAGVNSPEGIISPLDCRQGNFPMKRN